MKALIFIKPYSDDKLTYDEMSNQYKLTVEYCKSLFESTFKNDQILERRIEKNSDKIYNFIFSRVNSSNKDVVEKILSSTEQGRNFMLKLLTTQMEADVQSGYNDLTLAPAVNVANGQVIPREELQRNQVIVDVEQLLNCSSRYLGINIWYAARFPQSVILYIGR